MKKKRSNRRSNNRGQKTPWSTTLLSIAAIIAVLYGAKLLNARQNNYREKAAEKWDVTAMLHPVTNPAVKETIVEYEAMTVSFNPELHIPNWVSWELLGSETMGNEERSNKFITDMNVAGCATTNDYRGSGYDRGHIAPAADMRWSQTAMQQSFLMTNIAPQLHSLNGGAWKKLEEKCRVWAQADSAIIIIAGPITTDPVNEYIGETQVAVPQRFFKIIASPWANPPRGIGFIMPNGKVKGGIQAAAVSIDEVEAATGHNFFSQLPDSIERLIESECRFNYWSNLKPQNI